MIPPFFRKKRSPDRIRWPFQFVRVYSMMLVFVSSASRVVAPPVNRPAMLSRCRRQRKVRQAYRRPAHSAASLQARLPERRPGIRRSLPRERLPVYRPFRPAAEAVRSINARTIPVIFLIILSSLPPSVVGIMISALPYMNLKHLMLLLPDAVRSEQILFSVDFLPSGDHGTGSGIQVVPF